MAEPFALEIHHDAAAQHFLSVVDGQQCVLEYRREGNVMVITHTAVPAVLGGRGIAGALTRRALETAREHGWKVRPLCSYAEAWLRRHADYQDLLA